MTKGKNKNVLGRGLGDLLGGDPEPSTGASSIQELAIGQIIPNSNQPRREFDEDKLAELAASLRSIGLVQPITVQQINPEQYLLISGERRWRAAQMAGLATLPAYVRPTKPEEIMELALVENIQREDLNAIEIALAYQHLIELHHLKHEELAVRVGKKRATVTNYLRLLRLPAELQLGLTQRLIDMGHARALLQIEDTEHQIELYNLIVQEHLSVRAVEELARAIKEQSTEEVEPEPRKRSTPRMVRREDYRLFERKLSQVLTTKVTLRCDAEGKGKLTIPFTSDKELGRIIQLLEKLQH